MDFKDISVTDLFVILRGASKYTRDYGFVHRGDYPVYSASTMAPLTFIDTFDYEGEYLSWSTNGYAGTMKILSGQFSINADRALLKPKIDGIDLEYCRQLLEPIFRERAVGRIVDGKKNEYTKLQATKVGDIIIPIPVDKSGTIDVVAQKHLTLRSTSLSTLKEKSKDVCSVIVSCIPSLSGSVESSIELQLGGDWLQYITAKTTWTKAQYNSIDTGNDKDIPVFSAAKSPVAYVANKLPSSISASSDNPIISFASNGDGSAGTNFLFHTSPFYVSNDRTCIRIVDDKINPEYVFYSLHGIKQTYGFNHSFKATRNNLDNVTINIPVSKDGKYDVTLQKQLVNRYKKLYTIKKSIEDRLKTIISAKISIA